MGAGKFIKRLIWRWKNLTLEDFINSYRPVKINLSKLDIERYDSYLQSKPSFHLLEQNFSPFIVIKPSGVEHEDKIKELLEKKKVEILEEKSIDNYVRFGLHLYIRPYHDMKQILNSYLWFALDEYLYPDKLDKTKCLFLNFDTIDLDNLRDFKKEVRLDIGHIRFYRVTYKALKDEAFSSFIHVPDKEEIRREYSIAKNYKNDKRTRF